MMKYLGLHFFSELTEKEISRREINRSVDNYEEQTAHHYHEQRSTRKLEIVMESKFLPISAA